MQRVVLSISHCLYDLGSMNLLLYRDYFRHQAINHPTLAHTFTSRVFAMIGVDEDYGDLRSMVKEKDYVMRLLEYTYQAGQDQGGVFRKSLRGAFMVAKFYSPRNNSSAEYHAALHAAETIMDNIIEKMIRDSRNGHPLFGYALDSTQDFQIAPVLRPADGAYAGWECVFTLRPLFPEACDSVGWLDGGVTPYTLFEDSGAYLVDDTGAVLSAV